MRLVWLGLLGLSATIALRAQCVPARWPADPATLPLLADSPINCLVVDAATLQPAFVSAAAPRQVWALAQDEASAVSARQAGAQRLVLQGVFPDEARARLRRLAPGLIELRPRIQLDFTAPVIATAQAVWPGINTHDDDGKAETGPTGAPWIDTNAGFLRFARALASPGSEIWLAHQPPAKTAVSVERYLQVIADSAMLGARWILALDDDFMHRLRRGDAKAVAGWKRINQLLAFYESHAEWRALKPYGQLAVVQDRASGGLLSGGILDMIGVKHTPLVPVPKSHLASADLTQVKMTVNVDTADLTDAQKEKLRGFTRAGGTLLSGPPGWRMPPPSATEITLKQDDVKKLDDIWREVNSIMGRRNLGVRLFNVASMLSNITGDEQRVVLHLVNFSDYPVDSIAVHLLGKFRRATLLTPESPQPRALTLYENEDGSGVDVDTVTSVVVLLLDRYL